MFPEHAAMRMRMSRMTALVIVRMLVPRMRTLMPMRVIVTGVTAIVRWIACLFHAAFVSAAVIVVVIVFGRRARVSQFRTEGVDQVFQPCSCHGGALVFDTNAAGGRDLSLQHAWNLAQTLRKEPRAARVERSGRAADVVGKLIGKLRTDSTD